MASPPKPFSRLDQTITLGVLLVLIAGCFFVLQPFMTAILWAGILCATTWPLYVRLVERMRGRESLAAATMVTLIALALLAPFIVVGATIADNATLMEAWWHHFVDTGPPEPPAWLASLPLVGERAAAYWGDMAHDTTRLMDEARKYFEPVRKVVVASGVTVGSALLQLALSIFIAYFFFRDGDAVVGRLQVAAHRIAGERGRRLGQVAAATVRGVVLGILGTALVQGVLAGIGFAIAGMKAAPLLGFVTFFLSPVPIGPPLVWIPAGLWLIGNGDTGWGIFVLLWGALVVSTVDNFIKPLIISRGSDLPFALVLLGVLGGAVAFGFIGVFLGPVLLAVGFALVKEWAAANVLAPEGEARAELQAREERSEKGEGRAEKGGGSG